MENSYIFFMIIIIFLQLLFVRGCRWMGMSTVLPCCSLRFRLSFTFSIPTLSLGFVNVVLNFVLPSSPSQFIKNIFLFIFCKLIRLRIGYKYVRRCYLISRRFAWRASSQTKKNQQEDTMFYDRLVYTYTFSKRLREWE
jgi:hypothetical protein